MVFSGTRVTCRDSVELESATCGWITRPQDLQPLYAPRQGPQCAILCLTISQSCCPGFGEASIRHVPSNTDLFSHAQLSISSSVQHLLSLAGGGSSNGDAEEGGGSGSALRSALGRMAAAPPPAPPSAAHSRSSSITAGESGGRDSGSSDSSFSNHEVALEAAAKGYAASESEGVAGTAGQDQAPRAAGQHPAFFPSKAGSEERENQELQQGLRPAIKVRVPSLPLQARQQPVGAPQAVVRPGVTWADVCRGEDSRNGEVAGAGAAAAAGGVKPGEAPSA
jgi:hypothetical protein